MTPYKTLYGRRCRSPIYWYKVGERMTIGPEIIDQTVQVVDKIRDKIKAAQDR